MIIILALLVIGIIISTSVWRAQTRYNIKHNKDLTHGEGIGAIIASFVVFSIILCTTWDMSYTTYLDQRAFYSATKEQYHSATEVYKNHAVIDMGKAAFTDFKYQGYQENIGKFVYALRNAIIRYNKIIIKKRVMAKNPIFSWLIIKPDDDMVIIKMKSE